jgi:hypothetical protein
MSCRFNFRVQRCRQGQMAVEVQVAPSIIVLADEFVELSLQFANMQVRVVLFWFFILMGLVVTL